jgi:hypothetical protein
MSKKSKIKIQEQKVEVPEVDWAAIEALEKQARKEAEKSQATQQVVEESSITFDEWWMSREPDIKKPAYFKEIIRVDARARGLGKKELRSRWDWAARQFGLDI